MKALVIEDDDITRQLFVEALRDCGFDASSAGTAEDAVNVWREGPFDLITLDVGLSGEATGLEFCRWLRLQEKGEECFVLAITGRSDPEDLKEILDAGADDYLPKPVKMEVLLVRLAVADAHIAVSRQHREAAESSRHNAECFRALQELTYDAVVEIDRLEDRVLTANEAATDLLGWSPDDLQRRRAEEFLPEWPAIKGADFAERETQVVNEDGTKLAVQLRTRSMTFRGSETTLCVFRLA